MCEKHYYKYTHDGVLEKKSHAYHCSQARRRGVTCAELRKFKHPEGERPTKSTPQYLSAKFPPSPPSSDTSFALSGSDGERVHKHRSGVYVNGQKVAEVGVSRKSSLREKRNSNQVFIVEPPLSPRTPPRYDTPVGIPSRSPTYTHEPRSHQYPSFTHSEVRLEVNRPRRDSAVLYNYVLTRTSSRSRRGSQSQSSNEDAQIRRLQRELKEAKEAQRQAEEAAKRAKVEEALKEAARQRERKVAFDIRNHNDDIARRPVVLVAHPSLKKSNSTKYRCGSVSIQQNGILEDSMNKLRITETEAEIERRRRDKWARELREQQGRDAVEAQQERLRARMAPQRRVRPTIHKIDGSHRGSDSTDVAIRIAACSRPFFVQHRGSRTVC